MLFKEHIPNRSKFWSTEQNKKITSEMYRTPNGEYTEFGYKSDGEAKQDLFEPLIAQHVTTWNERLRYALENRHEKQADAEY